MKEYRAYVKAVVLETKLRVGDQRKKRCLDKYTVHDGSRIVHFKGRAGTGERFANCVEYHKCLGFSEKRAYETCKIIAIKKRSKQVAGKGAGGR